MTADSEKKRAAIKLLRSQISELGWRYALYCCIGAAAAYIVTLPPRIYIYFTDTIANENFSSISAPTFINELLKLGGLIAVALVISGLISTIAEEWIFLRVEGNLRRRIMKSVHRTPIYLLNKVRRGDWFTRMSSDLKNTETFITLSLPEQLRNIVIIACVGTFFAQLDVGITVIVLVAMLGLGVVNTLIQKKLKPRFEELREMHGDIFQALLESFDGLRSIQSAKAESSIEKRFDLRVAEITRKSLRTVRVVAILMSSNTLFLNILTTVSLCLVLWSFSSTNFTLAQALAYPFYLGLFCDACMSLVASTSMWNHFFVETGRLSELLEKNDNDPEIETLVVEGASSLTISDVQVTIDDLPPLTEKFVVTLIPGQITAVVGRSGCGKSTLLESLAGLRPLVTSNRRMMLPRELFSYVEQRPFLFRGTLRENLTLDFSKSFPSERIWEALQQVDLDSFFFDKGGLGFELTDQGFNLSEGQRYRLCLARALLLDRPFILLDEPFAALDDFSSLIVCDALNSLARSGKSLMIVTHTIPPRLNISNTLDFDNFKKIFFHSQHSGGRFGGGDENERFEWNVN